VMELGRRAAMDDAELDGGTTWDYLAANRGAFVLTSLRD
jgi:hypothetical protein